MFFKVFTNAKTGEELFAYSLYGTFKGEEEETKAILAYENAIDEENISVKLERRAGVPCEIIMRLKNGELTTTHYVYLNGPYYRMKCENARYAGRYEAWEFKNDDAAINSAVEHKATLTKEEWLDNERVSCVILYEPKQEATNNEVQ